MYKKALLHFMCVFAIFWAGWKLFPDVVIFDGYFPLFLVALAYFTYQELMLYGADYFYRVTTSKEKSAMVLFIALAIPIMGIVVLGLIDTSTDTFAANGFLTKFFLSACCFTIIMEAVDSKTIS